MRFLFSGMANASFKLPICKAVEYPMRDLKSDSIKRREAIKLENVSLTCLCLVGNQVCLEMSE
jgi:hypothetical protein